MKTYPTLNKTIFLLMSSPSLKKIENELKGEKNIVELKGEKNIVKTKK